MLNRYAEYDGMGIPNLAGCKEAMRMAAKLLSQPQPSLPSNLDEAAEEYCSDNTPLGATCRACFRDGAEWMAGQGVTKEVVIGMATEEIFINVSKQALDDLDLRPGDKVIVQIRKK